MGVAYYGNFLAFFETGRVEAMRQIAADYASIVRRGVHLPVVEAGVRYLLPTVFDDLLLVAVGTENIRGARFTFRYDVVRDSDQAHIATGFTVHACVDASSLRPIRMPVWLREDLALLA
jgi:acyl-CoA thioester hydrolase